MDNLTHSLFAATLARTRLDRVGRGTTAALLLASNAPDIDVVAAIRGGGVGYLHWHRGPTHGPLGIVGLALVTAGLVWGGTQIADRRRGHGKPGHAPFLGLVLVSMLGILLHILMDLPTSYGTRLLSPFDWRWYTTDLMPILDIYLIIVLAATLVGGRRSPRARRWCTVLALAFMAANYGARALLHRQALAAAPRVLLAPVCDEDAAGSGAIGAWPRASRTMPPEAAGPCPLEVAALPDFISPFRWRLVARFTGAYEVQDLDLLDRPGGGPDARAPTVHRVPNLWSPDALRAAQAEVPRIFLGFSRFPAVATSAGPDGTTTVRWMDLRFGDGVPRRNQDPRAGGLFSAMARLGPDGRVIEQGLGQ